MISKDTDFRPIEYDTLVLARRLSSGFSRLGRAVHQRGAKGLNPGQAAFIQAILLLQDEYENGVKASAISRKLGVAQPTITPVMNRLEDMGYIQRSIDLKDRRIVLVKLTDKGCKAYKKVMAEEQEKMLGLVEYLTPGEAGKLLELVEKAAYFYTEVYHKK